MRNSESDGFPCCARLLRNAQLSLSQQPANVSRRSQCRFARSAPLSPLEAATSSKPANTAGLRVRPMQTGSLLRGLSQQRAWHQTGTQVVRCSILRCRLQGMALSPGPRKFFRRCTAQDSESTLVVLLPLLPPTLFPFRRVF